MAHLSTAHQTAAGLRALPDCNQAFTAAQAAWRFYSNSRVTLPQLAMPLIESTKAGVEQSCKEWALVALDWCLLHYGKHESKRDRIVMARSSDLGYKLLTALLISDQRGSPLAPVCLELSAGDGIHSTRSVTPLKATSALDGLEPVMEYVNKLQLGRPLVYIVDREGDSIGHLRTWNSKGRNFLVRAKDNPRVIHEGRQQKLIDSAAQVSLLETRPVKFHGKDALQYTGETRVILKRPARTHRVLNGKATHRNIAGAPLELRLIVSEVRDADGTVLAQWLLLSNLPMRVSAATVALWYYWRWRIESYHKLLKSAGQQAEYWLQDNAAALARRLTVAAMAGIVVWQLARDTRPEAATLRGVLVQLSGRLMKKGKAQPGFTEPALLAGLGVLLSMLHLLENRTLEELQNLARQILPDLAPTPTPSTG
ncbi:MAG TPA: transposase [Candidatus Angelobacter sp.]|nr:transposase [Candidatus Angelobacter sp.]